MPYFRAEDIPEPSCAGSLTDIGWEGAWDDPNRPQEIACPICKVRMKPDFDEYMVETKRGIYFATVPAHYPNERPEFF
jgi:hypothetical protein